MKTSGKATSGGKQKQRNGALNVGAVLEEFEKVEKSSSTRRNGTFKINAPFEKALDTILKVKPEPIKPKTRRK
jgi:hypothetical protein